jgi:hypothetical protein
MRRGTGPAPHQLGQWVEERFPVRMGGWHDTPVGPHVAAIYQIAFMPGHFPTLVPFVMMNRLGLTVLPHLQAALGRPHDRCDVNGRGVAGEDRWLSGAPAGGSGCMDRPSRCSATPTLRSIKLVGRLPAAPAAAAGSTALTSRHTPSTQRLRCAQPCSGESGNNSR